MAPETNDKSSRHPKIAGNFGEALVLYLLSKCGFECALVDHVGIDIIAATKGEKMGISVKMRTRNKKNGPPKIVNIRRGTSKKPGDFEKAENFCNDFGCNPYFAFVVDNDFANCFHIFISPLQHVKKLSGFENKDRKRPQWNVQENWRGKYQNDKDVLVIEIGGDSAKHNYAQQINEWWQNHSRPESAPKE